MNTLIASTALLISLCNLLFAVYFWARSSRPIISVAVKTHRGGSKLIAYNLIVMNSGTIPARDIQVRPIVPSLALALGSGADESSKLLWLAGFAQTIPLLQNNDRVSCPFGTTKRDDLGFWKANAVIRVTIKYKDWFGWGYSHVQDIHITDSASFTGHFWEIRDTDAT